MTGTYTVENQLLVGKVVTEMKIINNSKELRAVFRPDKPCGRIFNHSNTMAYVCNTLIEFDVNGEHYSSRRWFINDDNELIYSISKNWFMNLDRFDQGTSRMKNLVAYDNLRMPERQLSLFEL